MNKKIIVVIVNWNRKKDVKNLLVSLQAINYKPDKIIVVDNASTDGSVEMLKEEFSYIFLVENNENLGGTGGFNTGMRKAMEFNPDYIWLLDNDVEVEENSLKGLVDMVATDENIAIAGSTICYPDYRDYIYETGGHFNWGKGIIIPCNRNKLFDRDRLNDFYEVDYCSACSLLVKASLIKSTGLMDENFFLTADDLEWTYRFKKSGYRVVATTFSRIYHQTKIVLSPSYIYYNCRNTFYLYSRISPHKFFVLQSSLYNFFLYSFLFEEAKTYDFKALCEIYDRAFKDIIEKRMGKCDFPGISFAKKDFNWKKELLDGAILPGVGAFGDAMNNLRKLDLIEPIKEIVRSEKFFMGICLGMQLLFSESEEFGNHKGLNLIEGFIKKFPNRNKNGKGVKVPQIGWNCIFRPGELQFDWDKSLLKNIRNGEFMYFVHSYYPVPSDKSNILTITDYAEIDYCSGIVNKNLFAFQFHPEKSATEGMKIYHNWAEMIINKQGMR